MNKLSVVSLIFWVALFLSPSLHAAPHVIHDNYIGDRETDSSVRDVIADSSSRFQIDNMTVNYLGGRMDVTVSGSFFEHYVRNQTYGMRLGDLFISTNGWNPYGSSPYQLDTALNGEKWEYVVVLGNKTAHEILTSGTYGLYAIPSYSQTQEGLSEAGILLSSKDPLSSAIYREKQEWAFDPARTNALQLASGSWNITNTTLSILGIDLSKLNITGDSLGFHWTMSCANDVIEGIVPAPVPEPSTLLLFASGMLGMASWKIRRRNFRM